MNHTPASNSRHEYTNVAAHNERLGSGGSSVPTSPNTPAASVDSYDRQGSVDEGGFIQERQSRPLYQGRQHEDQIEVNIDFFFFFFFFLGLSFHCLYRYFKNIDKCTNKRKVNNTFIF